LKDCKKKGGRNHVITLTLMTGVGLVKKREKLFAARKKERAGRKKEGKTAMQRGDGRGESPWGESPAVYEPKKGRDLRVDIPLIARREGKWQRLWWSLRGKGEGGGSIFR